MNKTILGENKKKCRKLTNTNVSRFINYLILVKVRECYFHYLCSNKSSCLKLGLKKKHQINTSPSYKSCSTRLFNMNKRHLNPDGDNLLRESVPGTSISSSSIPVSSTGFSQGGETRPVDQTEVPSEDSFYQSHCITAGHEQKPTPGAHYLVLSQRLIYRIFTTHFKRKRM